MTRLDDHQEPREAHPTPCQRRLQKAISEVLRNLTSEYWDTARVWLSMKRRVKRLDLGGTPIGQKFEEIIVARREKLVLAGATEEQLEQLLHLYPLVDAAAAEESMDAKLVAAHGCQHCRHFRTSWERRDGRDRADFWQKPCLIYGVVPPACFHHEFTAGCSQCGGPPMKPSPTNAGTGRDIPLLCETCFWS